MNMGKCHWGYDYFGNFGLSLLLGVEGSVSGLRQRPDCHFMVFTKNWVVVSNIFYFHPYLGKIPILTNIFQMGWNHQLENMLGPFKQIPMDDERDVWKMLPPFHHLNTYQHSLEDATNWPLSKHLKQIQVLCGFSKILFGEFQAARMKKLQRKNNGWNQIPIVATSILCRRLLLIATKSFN